MANEPIFNVASFDHKGKLSSHQVAVEARLLPYAGVTIAKVLSFCAECNVEPTDVFTGEARVSGRVIFRVLFLDGNGACRSMETSAEFTDKMTGDLIAMGTSPQIINRILDTDITSVAADEIRLAAVVEMDLLDNVSTRIKYLSACGEEIFSSPQKAKISKLVSVCKESITISDETNVEGDKILSAESRAVVFDKQCGQSNIMFQGQVITQIITEKEGEIYCYRVITDFKNECSADECSGDCFCDGWARLTKTSATLLTDADSAAVALEFDIEFNAHAYRTEEISLVGDAFSVTNQLTLGHTSIESLVNNYCKTVVERVEGAITLANDMPTPDKVLGAVGWRLNISNCYINQSNRIVLEGTVNASLIYFSAETGSKNSVDTELPFSIVTGESAQGKVVCAFGEVIDLSVKIKSGNQIDIKAEIAVFVSCAAADTIKFISQLEVGDSIEIPASAMSLHIARQGESLWEIAKALRTTPELIMVQNPDLDLPLNGGERVIVYRHLKR